MNAIEANIAAVRRRVRAAASACGRGDDEVALLAVAKAQPAAALQAAWKAGLRRFGENYVQEAAPHIAACPEAEWHFIGRLQSNKTRVVAERFAWLHTLDRASIAERLSAQRPPGLPPLAVCIQVNIDDEPSKGGVAPAEVADLAARVAALPRLRLRGLMAMPRPAADPRAAFAAVRELRDGLNRGGLALDTLSMGMSADLEAAIAEGATIVRIGTDIFGMLRR